jgi:hypothetical protein
MKFAVKSLTRSDLTLFDVQFRRQNAGNQKAINLNRNVFVDLLFPNAPAMANGPTKFPCELRLIGPRGISEPRVVMRKVIAAGGTQKNWRLNGETVQADPDGTSPERYDNLSENDIALFAFEGTVLPSSITILLLSAGDELDDVLHSALQDLLGGKRMRAVSEQQLQQVVDLSSDSHPIRELLDPVLDNAAEDAALGSPNALEKLRQRGIARNSHEALAKAKANMERIGRDGEILVNAYLKGEVNAGRLVKAVWEAETNATHPFDFSVFRSETNVVPVEVKTTQGEHGRDLILSHGEAIFAANNPNVELWRVSRIGAGTGEMRISRQLSTLARKLVKIAETVGEGIVPNAWTIPSAAMEPWSAFILLNVEDDPDE